MDEKAKDEAIPARRRNAAATRDAILASARKAFLPSSLRALVSPVAVQPATMATWMLHPSESVC